MSSRCGGRRERFAGPDEAASLPEAYEGEIDLKSKDGRTSSDPGSRRPSAPDKLQKRADEAWSVAKLKRITLHECRHTFASLMIAAGVNAESLQALMGHAYLSVAGA